MSEPPFNDEEREINPFWLGVITLSGTAAAMGLVWILLRLLGMGRW